MLIFSPLVLFVVGVALFKCHEQVAQAREQARARGIAADAAACRARAKFTRDRDSGRTEFNRVIAEAEAAAEASRKKSDMDLHMTAWDTRSAPAASMASRLTPAAMTEDAGHSTTTIPGITGAAGITVTRVGGHGTSSVMPAAPATRTVAMRVPPGMGPVLRP